MKLKEEKIKKISENKDILLASIENEIIKNSFYREGMYKYQLKNDKTIQQAVTLLNNKTKYNSILKK